MKAHRPNAITIKTINAQWWAITSVVVDILFAYSSKVALASCTVAANTPRRFKGRIINPINYAVLSNKQHFYVVFYSFL